MPQMKLSLLCLLQLMLSCLRLWVTRIRIFAWGFSWLWHWLLHWVWLWVTSWEKGQSFHQIFKRVIASSKTFRTTGPDQLLVLTQQSHSIVWGSQKCLFKNRSCSRLHLVGWGGLVKILTLAPKISPLSPPCLLSWYVPLLDLFWTWEMGKKMGNER